MPRTLKMGFVGADVVALQGALNLSPPCLPPLLVTDGIFGAKTLTRVKAFQRNNGLMADGIVGPLTWGKLLQNRRPTKAYHRVCGCSDGNQGRAAQLMQALAAFSEREQGTTLASFNGGNGLAPLALKASPPLLSLPKLRRLVDAEKNRINQSYGNSIDYSRVYLTDQTGLGGRAFVFAMSHWDGYVQFVNIGTNFTNHTLIHEMGHVWQSQHHADKELYMWGAVRCQMAADAANLLFGVTSYSAYAYVPGKPFSEYGAEQLAQQVANDEAPIVAHVKSIARGAIDPDLILDVIGFEDTAAPGVKI